MNFLVKPFSKQGKYVFTAMNISYISACIVALFLHYVLAVDKQFCYKILGFGGSIYIIGILYLIICYVVDDYN